MATFWAFTGLDGRVGWAREDGGQLEVFPSSGRSSVHALSAASGVHNVLSATQGATGVEQMRVEPGKYHPRVWRPLKPAARDFERDAWASAATAARILFDRLAEVLRFVEPSSSNLNAFGHELRMLLILACTEVESGWSGVLTANSYAPGRWSTNDYVKLLGPMNLERWSVELAPALELGAIKPFDGWNAQSPTTSLKWYDAYNQVKHFREGNLHRATLQHCIHAVAAVYVMFVAQFGTWEGFSADMSLMIYQQVNPREIAGGGHLFRLREEPTFTSGMFYGPPRITGATDWVAVPMTV